MSDDVLKWLAILSLTCGVVNAICRPWAKSMISHRHIYVGDVLSAFGIGLIPVIGWAYAIGYIFAVVGTYAESMWRSATQKIIDRYPVIKKILNYELF